ncbi:DUF1015 domain-containing protein [Streptomyces sp. NPDC059002]|uniref:DUF1015 domain-containing protein n=1 Tax=Streptomyces sp. NPDC059002 TaxID=3346690 RepID=UPI0036C39BED
MPRCATPGPTGLDLRPFRAVRYDPAYVGDLSGVISPPYDDMPRAHGRAQRVRPHHIRRLLCTDDPWAARGQLHRWLSRGVLRRDEKPAIYLYEQRHAHEVLQRGLIGELRLPTDSPDSPDSPGPLLPHEAVRPHEVRRHTTLMAALGAQLEPLLVACRPTDRTLPLLIDRLVRRPPMAIGRTGRITHRLWACTDPAEQRALTQGLATGPALIADGHHRHAATLRLMTTRGGDFWNGAQALVVDTVTHPLRLSAIHRVLPGLDPSKAAALAADVARVRQLPEGPREPRGDELLLTGGGSAWAVSDFDAQALGEALTGRPAPWQELPVAVADHLLVSRAFSVPDLPGAMRHVHTTERAIAETAAPDSGVTLLLPAMSESTVWELASHGVLLPRKSTAFAPKPAAGFALRVSGGSP